MSLLPDNVKNFLLKIFNRNFLTFLVCLGLSGFFWLMLTMNETITKELPIQVNIGQVSDDYHLISDNQMNVNVTVSGQGLQLLGVARNMEDREAVVNFAELVKKADQDQGVATVSESELLAVVRKKLGSVRITDVKPKELKIYFTKGKAFKVPVKLNDPRIIHKEHHFVVKTTVEPDSVTVYAIPTIAKSIKQVNINYFVLDEAKEGNEKVVKMPYKAGVKYDPKEVTVRVTTDLLAEDTMKVRITVPDIGDYFTMRCFPPSVVVRYTVPVSRKEDVKKAGFVVKPVMKHEVTANDSVMEIELTDVPAFVLNPKLEVQKVGFLLERK